MTATPAEQALKTIEVFIRDETLATDLRRDWPDLHRELVALVDRAPMLRLLAAHDNMNVPVTTPSDDDIRALLPSYMRDTLTVHKPWPTGGIMEGVEWLVRLSTGQVLTYAAAGDARRAFRTEYGRQFMVRYWDAEAGGLVVRDLTGEL